MVHPNVFKHCKLTMTILQDLLLVWVRKTGMLKYGMPDLRDFFEGDINWLQQYGFSPFDTSDLSWRKDEVYS